MSETLFQLYVDSKFTSPYAMSVFVTLTEKSLPFDLHPIDLDANEHYATDYADLSLTCRVPTLTHGEFHLSESSAIENIWKRHFRRPIMPLSIRVTSTIEPERAKSKHGSAAT